MQTQQAFTPVNPTSQIKPFNKDRKSSSTSKTSSYLSEEYKRVFDTSKSLVSKALGRRVMVRIYGKDSPFNSCGRYASNKKNVELIQQKDGNAGFRGRWLCKNRNCPTCSRIISKERITQTNKILNHPELQNSTLVFITLTRKRKSFDDMSTSIKELQEAFNLWINSVKKKRLGGYQGHMKVVEVTQHVDTKSSHPHFHLLMALKPDTDVNGSVKYMKDRWVTVSKLKGLHASHLGQKFDVIKKGDTDSIEKIGRYIHKLDKLGFELHSGISKKGRREGSFTFGELIRGYHERDGDWKYREAIKRYVEGTKGKKMFSLSKSFRSLLEVDEEVEVEGEENIMDNLKSEGTKITTIPLMVFRTLAIHKQLDNLALLFSNKLESYFGAKKSKGLKRIFLMICNCDDYELQSSGIAMFIKHLRLFRLENLFRYI